MLSVGDLRIDLAVLATIAILAFIDLTLRYFVFHRLESAAIDVALFSFAYSVIEFGHALSSDNGSSISSSLGQADTHESVIEWGERVAIGVVFVLILFLIHIYLDERLKEHVTDVISGSVPTAGRGAVQRRRMLEIAAPLIHRNILLTYTGPEVPSIFRRGKRNWRIDAANLINEVAGLRGNEGLTDVTFLLPRFDRLAAGSVFFILASASIFVPACTILH